MPNDDLANALGQLNPQELQQLHTATYQIKYGRVSGNFDSSKVDRLWDAIQPVVARGGGPERSAGEAVAAQPGIKEPLPGEAQKWYQYAYKPARSVENIVESAASLGRITDVSKYESYLSNPAVPKTRLEAFAEGTNESITQLASNPLTYLGGVASKATKAVIGAAAEYVNIARTAHAAHLAATAAGDSAEAAAQLAKAQEAYTHAIRLARTAQASAVVGQAGGGAVQAGYGVEQAVTGRTPAEKGLGVAQTAMGLVGVAGGVMGARAIPGQIGEQARSAMPGVSARYNPPGAAPQVAAEPSPPPRPAAPAGAVVPTLRPEVAAMAKAPEITPEMQQHQVDLYQTILRHPDATPEERIHAGQRLNELGALERVVPTIQKAAPAARGVAEIAKSISAENRPKDLPPGELQQLADLSPTTAKALGLSRDDHMAAKAAWKRLSAPPEDAPVSTPGTEVHQAITRVLRSKATEDLGRRGDELQDALSRATSLAPDVKARLVSSLTYRADQSGQLAESLGRIRDAKDYAAGVTEELHRNASGNIAAERVGVDQAGHTFVEPLSEEEAATRGATFTPNFVSGISSPERMALNTWRGNILGGPYGKGKIPRYKIAYDPELKTPVIPGGLKSLSPEEQTARKDLTASLEKEVQDLHAEVWAQGGVPNAEQHSKMVQLFSLLESTTGHSLRFSGKKPVSGADPQSIDPNRAWMNWAMRRPATSHFAKPDDAALNRRIEELNHERDIAKLASEVVARTLPKDHVTNPEAPKVAAAPVTPNGSAESAASLEAINRVKTEAPRERVDTRSGIATPIAKTVDAVDVQPQPHEVILQGGVEIARGAKAGTVPAKIKRYELNLETGKYELSETRTEQVPAPEAAQETPESREAKREEISKMYTHLANLELKGQGGTKTAQRIRLAIQQYESVLGMPEVNQGFVTSTASSMLQVAKKAEKAAQPKQYTSAADNSAEGKSDALIALAHMSSERINRPLMGALLKLHDYFAEQVDDRDYLAHAATVSAEGDIDKALARYAGSLRLLQDGLKAGKGPMALQDASYFAQHGKLPKKASPGEAGFIVPTFIPDILNEIGKYASNAKATAVDVFKWAHGWFTQGTYRNVSPESRNAMFKFRGELNRVEDLGRVAFNDGITAIRTMPTTQQLQLMANAQRGDPLPTQDLQGLRDVLQQIQDQHYVRMRELRPNLNYWQDHIGTIWEKPPSNAAQLFSNHANVINRAVLQGDRGMLRRRIYETVLEGIQHGGVPATTNLFEMALLDLGRQAQFIHANTELLPAIKAQGRLGRGPEEAAQLKAAGLMPNPVRVPDNIVSTWFPVETAAGGTVIAKGAPYFMEAGELKMLQNWLAPDFVRRNVVGKTLLNFKNIYTPIELFGPFHLASIVAKSAALGLSQGINRAFNVGVLQNSLSDAVGGLKDMLTGLATPFTAYKNGRVLREAGGQTLTAWQKYNYDKQAWLNTPDGQRLSKVIPNLEETIDGLLEAGARLDVNPMYATKWRQALVQSWVDRKFIKSAAMVPFAGLEALTSQLFQKYIPAVKLFAASKEINVELARQASMIQSGETTREAVMQAAVRRVDNILGELNWENLNASRGMRSLSMLVWRSPGWRGGTADLVKNAIGGQGREFYQSAVNRRVPTIDPNLLYVMSSIAIGAAFATAIMALMAHKAPSSVTDLTNPQTGQLDSRGKPIRLDLPLYTSRDIPEILTNPFGYATGGQTGFVSKTVEAAKNRTYQGSLVTERTGMVGAVQRGVHAVTPVPFGYTGYRRLQSQGFPAGEGIALNLLGLNPSRRDLDMTPAERILSDAERRFSITRDANETAKLQAKQAIQGAYLNGRYDDLRELEVKTLREGTLSFKELEKAVADAQKPYIERMAGGSAVRPKDLLRAYEVGSESERRELMPFVWKALKKQPGLAPEFQKLVQEHQ